MVGCNECGECCSCPYKHNDDCPICSGTLKDNREPEETEYKDGQFNDLVMPD